MAGRGRGRGASFTFDIQAIGFSKGESLPETQLKPLPDFPQTEYKPVPLRIAEDQDYMLALKQELRRSMKVLPYFMEHKVDDQRIERYSKKYETEIEKKMHMAWTPDWTMLPRELKPTTKKLKKQPIKTKVAKSSNVDVLKKIEELEKKGDEEKSDEENVEKKKEGEEEEEEGELEIEDEEEHEEENDYIASYFEDGDDFAVSDDNMDEATY